MTKIIDIDLVKSTKQVFEECASLYLKEDRHWGCDMDVIIHYVNQYRNPEVIDLGTGHAWHLANLFFLSNSNLKKIIGVDFSEKMINMARNLLSSITINGKLLVDKIELKVCDILKLEYDNENFNIALLLNNTLGNIPPLNLRNGNLHRVKILEKVFRMIKNQGYIILSVYNADKLPTTNKYSGVFELSRDISDLENNDLIVTFKKTGIHYYSHWFYKDEIKQLLIDCNFVIKEIEERKQRIVVVAQKNI